MPYITAEQRAEIPEDDFAGPHRSFPIRSQKDVEDAARLIGHAEDPEQTKRAIIRIAKRKGLSLPESWQESDDEAEPRHATKERDSGAPGSQDFPDTVVFFGDAVKSLDSLGKIGGYLIRWGSPQTPDASAKRDYFTKETNLGHLGNTVELLYKHGMDPIFDVTSLGNATLKSDDVGIWLEGQLALRNEYEQAIKAMIDQGKLGFSSGSPPHLIRRVRQKNGTHFIKNWRISEASLTPTPADPYLASAAVSLKSLMAIDPGAPGMNAGDSGSPGPLRRNAVVGGLDRVHSATLGAVLAHVHNDGLSHAARLDACKSCYEGMTSTSLRLIDHMMDPRSDADDRSGAPGLWIDHVKSTFANLKLSDHSEAVRAAVLGLVDRYRSLAALKSADGHSFSVPRVAELEQFQRTLAALMRAVRPVSADQDALIASAIAASARAALALTG